MKKDTIENIETERLVGEINDSKKRIKENLGKNDIKTEEEFLLKLNLLL